MNVEETNQNQQRIQNSQQPSQTNNVVHLTDPTSQYMHVSKYSRWLENEGRRETWTETVDRYMNHMSQQFQDMSGKPLDEENYQELRSAILNQEIMPSMRAMMTAGKALRRDNQAGFNCTYLAVNNVFALSEVLFLLASGTGVGFSVERQEIKKLPMLPREFVFASESSRKDYPDSHIIFEDSKQGWAEGFHKYLLQLYSGVVPTYDVAKLRPAGARLRTFGGRASGPQPLINLLEYTKNVFLKAKGTQLTSLEVHGIVCKIAESIVSGGVRRSALISLSNPSDDRMRHAKSGNWWETDPHYALANNSAAWTEKPEMGIFMEEWISLYNSKSGERGIYNRQAADLSAKCTGRRQNGFEWGVNPCAEIILRNKQMCNLTEVVCRAEDTPASLCEKVRLATILGCIQSTLTNFPYLSPEWQKNCEEERLLGVSLTGIYDCYLLNDIHDRDLRNNLLSNMKSVAINTAKEWSDTLGINMPTAITTVKPSGSVSQLVNSSSGIHARHSQYYIRTYRENNMNPICQFMKDAGIPNEPSYTAPKTVTVFSFPVAAPENTVTRNELSAITQLENWLDFKRFWAEHSVSCTVSVKEHEWMQVGAWVYDHFDEITGLSFLPEDGGSYQQAPFQACSKEEYEALLERMPQVDWNKLSEYEVDDTTEGAKELACSAATGCDL